MPIRAGDLNRRITIERPDDTRDALGNAKPGWVPIGTVWAHRLVQRATESWKAGGSAGEREVTYRVRYSAALLAADETCRIIADGLAYRIKGAPIEYGRREGLEITAVASGEQP